MKILKLLVTAVVMTMATAAYAQKAETPKSNPAAAPAATSAKEQAKTELVDVNSADEKTLMTLKGIGEVTAAKIIKSRPYSGKDDLVKKKVLTEKVYGEIKDQIIAKQKK
ncbi:MAG: ComEA family DNA-binding protein [Burkholderiales bacterium]